MVTYALLLLLHFSLKINGVLALEGICYFGDSFHVCYVCNFVCYKMN